MLISYDLKERVPGMQTRNITANEVRIPELVAGEAVVIERYGKPFAAVIGAADFDLFQRMLEMFGEHQPSELSLSDTELAVHRSSEAGENVEGFDLGLLETHAAQ